jgi:hypothetical protein
MIKYLCHAICFFAMPTSGIFTVGGKRVGNRNFRAFSLADVNAAVEGECVLNAARLELMAEW